MITLLVFICGEMKEFGENVGSRNVPLPHFVYVYKLVRS